MAAKAMQMPNLETAAINIQRFRDKARKDLCDALDSMRGKKVLVLDPKLSGPLSLIAQTSLLKDHGVEQLYYLEKEPPDTEVRNIVYLVRPRLELMQLIAEQVRGVDGRRGSRAPHEHSVFFVPRRTIICEKVLEEEGVYGDITLGEFNLELIPFEEDVLSLELETSFRDVLVEGDRSSLYYVARSLQTLQGMFGAFPHVKAKGTQAAAVMDMMSRMRREQGRDAPSTANSELETLILIDREVDLYTPMCTQLTYEGLIDEVLRINNGAVEFTVEGDTPGGPAKAQKTRLNSTDSIFRELRDLNFGRACDRLREKSIAIQQDYKNIKDLRVEDQKVSDIKGFVKTVKDNMSGAGVDLHATIAKQLMDKTRAHAFMKRLEMERSCVEQYGVEAVYDYVEQLMFKQEPISTTLKMLALLSLTQGGLAKKRFEGLKRDFLHAYGYEHMETLTALAKVGLVDAAGRINVVGKVTSFSSVRKALRLVVDNMDDNNPDDIAYAFSHSGYAPLSVRLIHLAIKGQWPLMEDVMKNLPGPHQEVIQMVDEQGMPVERPEPHTMAGSPGSDAGGGRKKPIMVFFLGGVTFAEISALRFISQQEEVNRDIIIGTTKMINGSSLLETLITDPMRPPIDDAEPAA